MAKGASRVTRECKPPMGPSLAYMAEIALSIDTSETAVTFGFSRPCCLGLDVSNETEAAQL